MNLSRYVDEEKGKYFIYAPDKKFDDAYIWKHITGHSERANLEKYLYDLGDGVVNNLQYAGKIEALGVNLYHNSGGQMGKSKKSYSIFYIIVADKKSPDTIAENEDLEDIIYLNRDPDDPSIVKRDDEIFKIQSGNIIRYKNEDYHVFPVLLGIGHHAGTGSHSYMLDVRNSAYLDKSITI